MHYKLYDTKISDVEGIQNRFYAFIETLNEVELFIESHRVWKRKTQKALDLIEQLEKVEIIGHLRGKMHDIIVEVSIHTRDKWFDCQVIELLGYYDEIRRIINALNFQYEKEQAEIEVEEIEKREDEYGEEIQSKPWSHADDENDQDR